MATVNMHFHPNSNSTFPANAHSYSNSSYRQEFYAEPLLPTNIVTVNYGEIVNRQDTCAPLSSGAQVHFPSVNTQQSMHVYNQFNTHATNELPPHGAQFHFQSAINNQNSMHVYNQFNQDTTQQLAPPRTPPGQNHNQTMFNIASQTHVNSTPSTVPSTASTYTEFWNDYSSPLAAPYTKKQDEKALAGHDMSEQGLDLFNIGKLYRGVNIFGDELGMNQQKESMMSTEGVGMNLQEEIMLSPSGKNQQGEDMHSKDLGTNQKGKDELPGSSKNEKGNYKLPVIAKTFKQGRPFADDVSKAPPKKKAKVGKSKKTSSEPKLTDPAAKLIKEQEEQAERLKRQCHPSSNSYQEQRLQCLLMNHLQGELTIDPKAAEHFFAPEKVTAELVYHKSLPIEELCLDYFGLTEILGLKYINITIHVWKGRHYESETTIGVTDYSAEAVAVCLDSSGKVIEEMFGDKLKGTLTLGWGRNDDPEAFYFADMIFEELLQVLRRTAIRDFDEEGNARTAAERDRREEQLGELIFSSRD
jgi:hypothetical protein